MKIYEMDDCDWYAANSLEEAIQQAVEDTGNDPRDYEGARELTEEEMARLRYVDEDGTKRSFSEQLAKEITEGTLIKPGLFATTEH